jgi:hypothetical protein
MNRSVSQHGRRLREIIALYRKGNARLCGHGEFEYCTSTCADMADTLTSADRALAAYLQEVTQESHFAMVVELARRTCRTEPTLFTHMSLILSVCAADHGWKEVKH